MRSRILSLLACLFLLAGCSPSLGGGANELVINEYLLSYGPDISTEQVGYHFANGDREEIQARTEAYRDIQAQVIAYNSQVLETFGYTLKPNHWTEYGFTRWVSGIWQGERLVAKDIAFMKPISVNASKTNFIGIVELWDGGTYVITRAGFEKRPWPEGRAAYLYVGDRLLSIERESTAHQQTTVRVYLDDDLAFQENTMDVSTYATFDGPWGWDGHWALVLLDAKMDVQGSPEPVNRVIQDGEDMNTLKGYQQSFQFTVLDGRPFYFFQRDGKIGISFNGQEFNQGYDEIPHYQCCSGALLNPGVSMNMVWFFARRGEDWYYVEAYIPFSGSN